MNQPRSRCRIRFEELRQVYLSRNRRRIQSQVRISALAKRNPQHVSSGTQLDGLGGSTLSDNIESNTDLPRMHESEVDAEMLPGELPFNDESDSRINTSNHYHIDEYPGSAKVYGSGSNFMDRFDADQYSSERTEHPYYPFASRDEWEFGSYLLRSRLSMAAIDQLLNLELVRISTTLYSTFMI